MNIRPSVTNILSMLVEKRLNAKHSYWSPEVDFDKNTSKYKRIDYVGFKPNMPDGLTESSSVELGTFTCYEVKSCMADFKSGNGLSFYGDENFLVCTKELAEQLRDNGMLPNEVNGVLVPNKPQTSLITKFDLKSCLQSNRKKVASEMLWAIVQSHDRPKRVK